MGTTVLKALLEHHSDSRKIDWEIEQTSRPRRIFLLSPVNANGVRARIITGRKAKFQLAVRLREQGLPLGDVFTFISGLYFRGKIAYANAFGGASSPSPSSYVIMAGRGLIPPHTIVTQDDLRKLSGIPIDHRDARFREPLERDARALGKMVGPDCEVVLLGSIATPKYVEPLLGIFGERLLFPSEFVGRGDMSRGSLMLRSARENIQLTYVPVATAERHGRRPPKLPEPPRREAGS